VPPAARAQSSCASEVAMIADAPDIHADTLCATPGARA
jgi:hypothetical protein